MLARPIRLTGCLMAYSPTVRARQIIFDCKVMFTPIRPYSPHHAVNDADDGIVGDNTITTAYGFKTPNADDLEEWVEVDDGVVAWGNRPVWHGLLKGPKSHGTEKHV